MTLEFRREFQVVGVSRNVVQLAWTRGKSRHECVCLLGSSSHV